MNYPTKECSFCGSIYQKNPKYSATQWNKSRACSRKCSSSQYHIDDAEISKLFNSGMLLSEIVASLSVTLRVVQTRLNHLGLARSASETLKISHNRSWVREKLSIAGKGRKCPDHVKEILRGLSGPKSRLWKGGITSEGPYATYTSSPHNGGNAKKTVHTVLAEKYLGYVRGKGLHVHHIDGDKKNNNLANLKVMTASDHARHHALENGFGRK